MFAGKEQINLGHDPLLTRGFSCTMYFGVSEKKKLASCIVQGDASPPNKPSDRGHFSNDRKVGISELDDCTFWPSLEDARDAFYV